MLQICVERYISILTKVFVTNRHQSYFTFLSVRSSWLNTGQ